MTTRPLLLRFRSANPAPSALVAWPPPLTSTSPPALGTTFPLGKLNVLVNQNSVAAAGVTDGTVTYRGTAVVSGVTYPVFDLSIPSLSVVASNLRGDGTAVLLAGGGQVSAAFASLTYTGLGAWTFEQPNNAGAYLGISVIGSGTPGASVPTVGSATYSGAGKAVGAYFVPTGGGAIQAGTLAGNVSLTTNFAANTFSGTLSGMTATAIANGTGSTPWNDVSLNGTINRGAGPASLSGTTGTTGASGITGFSSAATGNVSGLFYGPNYEEVGANWTLYEPTSSGGKAAMGAFGGAR